MGLKVNAPLSAALVSALGLRGQSLAEWSPELIEALQPVVVLADATLRDTQAERAGFSGFANQAAGGTGQPKVQLWNAPGSGVTLRVNRVMHQSGTASMTVLMALMNVALAVVLNGPGFPSRFGGGAGSPTVMRGNNLIGDPAPPFPFMLNFTSGAINTNMELIGPQHNPIFVPEGWGLVVFHSGAVGNVFANFEWTESPPA